MIQKLLLIATMAALPWPAFAVEGDFHWSGRLNPGQSVEIKGVNGVIHAEYTSASDVQVDARKSARRSDISSVRVEAVPHSGGVTICSVYPSDGGRPNECRPGNEGRMSTRDNDVKVDYTVHVPKGVRLIAKTVNGEVTALNLQSDVDAHTVNGRVQVSTTGLASAHTVNGGIEASLGASTWDDTLEFTTVNGGVRLSLPPGISADVKASVVNGGISTDFPLTISGRWGPKSINGRIGNGGRSLKVTTVNGGIELRSNGGRVL
jgi:hypothetical protein